MPLLAQRRVSWAWVKAVWSAFGGGSGFCQAIWLMILKFRLCKANPRLKMMWCVPETHNVPSGLSTRRAAFSHRTLNSWSALKPLKRIESLHPAKVRFRVLLGGDSVGKLEVLS